MPVSDDPAEVWLTPERVKAARGLLNWTPADLAIQARVPLRELTQFEDYGVMLDVFTTAAILHVLLKKVEFTTTEGEPGVVRKPHVGVALGPGHVQFGGPLKRRPKL